MKGYKVILRDADGQPLTSYDCYGMLEVQEQISVAREDWAHYPKIQVIVEREDGVRTIDRTYTSRVPS